MLAAVRAIVWSGSTLGSLPQWLVLLGLGVLAGVRNIDPVAPMLKSLGMEWLLETSPWAILATGLIFMVAILAVRIARAETTPAIFGRPTFRPDQDGNLIGRVPVRLISGKEQGRVALKIYNLDGSEYDGQTYSVMTEQRLKAVRSGGARFVGRINFDTTPKNLELIHYENSSNSFVIEHDAGAFKLPADRGYKLHLTVTSDHGEADNWLLMVVHSNENIFRLSDRFSGEETAIP
jgi:hypothetical protein